MSLQIIGLTASLGVGNAQSATEAVDHFVKMCANLDIEALSFVRENINELNLYSSVAVDGNVCFFLLNKHAPFVICKQIKSILYGKIQYLAVQFKVL